jgi:hypothetical protein
MSTYGRGLYRLEIEEGQESCNYVELPKGSIMHDTTIVVKPKTGDKHPFTNIDDLFCDDCTVALATESHITDIQMDDFKIRRVGIAGGSLIHFLPGIHPEPIPFEVFLEKRLGEFSGDPLLNELVNDSLPIRGIVTRDNEIEAIIIGTKPIMLEEFPSASINIQAESGSGPEYIPAGQPFFVYGTNFSSMQEASHVEFLLDGEVIFETETTEEGRFEVLLTQQLNVGIHQLTAIQQTPARLISAEIELQVVVNEGED